MELPQDKILSSFTGLLHHHGRDFNNKIVIGCRGDVGGLGGFDNNAENHAGGRVKRSSELEQWSSVLFWGVQLEHLDDANIFALLQMYAAFSSIGKASPQKLLPYLETHKGKNKHVHFHFSISQALFFQLFLPFCQQTHINEFYNCCTTKPTLLVALKL